MASVIVFGETFLDINCCNKVPELRLGGAGANLAVFISLLGGDSGIITKIANDFVGEIIFNELRCYGVDTQGIYYDMGNNRNIINFIFQKADDDIHYLTYSAASVDDTITKKDIDVNLLDKFDVFHFGSRPIAMRCRDALLFCIKKAKEINKKISYDVNYREGLWANRLDAVRTIREFVSFADYVKMNAEEAMLYADVYHSLEEALQYIRNIEYEKYFFITDAENGSYIIHDGKIWHIPVRATQSIDNIGAGDAYYAVILHQLDIKNINNNQLIEIAKKANRVAALTTTYQGTIKAFENVLIELRK